MDAKEILNELKNMLDEQEWQMITKAINLIEKHYEKRISNLINGIKNLKQDYGKMLEATNDMHNSFWKIDY